MKNILTLILFATFVSFFSCSSKYDTTSVEIEFSTSEGDFSIFLFDETPKHKENFIKLAETNFYDSVLFHRVIKNFVIQAGDPSTKQAEPKKLYGEDSFGEKITPEMCPKFNHIKGAVGAAREGDEINPEKLSSGSHFYVVLGGNNISDETIYKTETRLGQNLSDSIKQNYIQNGGAPHLDGEYTIFGYISDGMDVVEKIATYKTDNNDRPLNDIQILSTKVNILTEEEKQEKYNNYAK